jgi:Uma2 family endonuclease
VATTTTKLMTFAEFEQLPNPPEGFRLELRHGELFKLPPAKWNHFLLQDRLRALLQNAAGETGKVATEFGFRPTQENEYLIADVAFASMERWKSTDPAGYFSGAPEIVIEVLSPSNTATEMLDKRNICLENGSREFWIVDTDHRQVEVSTPDGHTITYKSGQEIPLFFGGRLAVDSIFTAAEG